MNKAVDKSYRLLGARFLRKHAKRLAAQLEPVCAAEQIEAVHQARVASRRLRAALCLFADCFPDDSIKRWQTSVRRITQGLGAARDQDVQIQFLANHLAQLDDPAHVFGVAAILARVQRDRARAQAKVVKVVRRFEQSGTLDEILDTAQAICARAKNKGTGVRSPLVIQRAEACVAQRLEELHEHAKGLENREAAEEHHAMRIAAKRLRYSLEMLSPVFSGELNESLVTAKQLQTLLGEIHDYDVWNERIDWFERKIRQRTLKHYGTEGPFAPLQAGLEHFRSYCRRRRDEIFDQLRVFWSEQPLSEREQLSDLLSPPPHDSSTRCTHGRALCSENG